MNRAFNRSFATIVAINGHFLVSAICGGTAWLAWPQTPEWWGLGVFSVFLTVAAAAALLKAIKAIAALHGRERAIAEFESLGKSLMKDEFKAVEKIELYDWGKELEERFYRPQIEADAREREAAQARGPARTALRTRTGPSGP